MFIFELKDKVLLVQKMFMCLLFYFEGELRALDAHTDTHLLTTVTAFPIREYLNAATLCIHEPQAEHVKAASPLAKAAELCYVNVGDGKQQLPALLSPFSL